MKNMSSARAHLNQKPFINPLSFTKTAKMFTACLLLILGISASAFAQSTRISIHVKNTAVKEVLRQIEEKSGYTFMYDNKKIEVDKTVSLEMNNRSVSEILEVLFASNPIKTNVVNKRIILTPGNEQASTARQQSKHITGKVTDEKGATLPGVSIMVKGSNIGTTTDVDGKFTLPQLDKGKVLEFSYVGMTTQQVAVSEDNSLSVILKSNAVGIEEVVVVGYGTQKKVNLTGAVSSVTAEALDSRPIKSATDALQGTVSGLTVSSGTGQPGSFASFKVRGNTSVNSAGALVIIDGMPGDLNKVNPQDIESVSVLKDAASAAIYGARAAEGVILVTTKQGNSSKVKVEYTGNASYNIPTRLPESNTGLQHALLSNIAFVNAGLAPKFSQEAIDAFNDPSKVAIANGNDWVYTANTDWISMMMDHSFQQNHNVTISKSADQLKYLISAGWLDQDGMFSEYGPDNFDRINLRSNVSIGLVKNKLDLDSKITYTSTAERYHPAFNGSDGWTIPYITFVQAGPNMPVYDPNGNYARHNLQLNPIQAMREGGLGASNQQTIDGIFTLAYKPVKGLTVKAIGGVIVTNSQTKEWRKMYGKYNVNGLLSMAAGQRGPNSIDQSSTNRQYLTSQLLAEYTNKFDKHEVNILGGWSTEENIYKDLNAYRTNIIGNELPALNLGSTDGWKNSANENDWALISGFMRANYAFDSKYLAEVNFRADASSRFSKKNRWGVFPSASIGWRVTQEDFMKDQRVFSNLKFRASWGQLGNQNGLGLYDHIPQYGVGGFYPFAGSLGQWAILSSIPSQDRTWETVEIKNVAVDMSFLNNRLSATAEYFIKNNKDMLVSIEIPSIIGIKVPTGNYGELEVKGWELSINWRDKIDDFSYGIGFNLSDQKDKLVDYGVKYNGFIEGIGQKVQGYSLGSIFGYETAGYFTTPEEVKSSAVINKSVTGVGDIKYIDQDGDGTISAPNDLKYLGTTTPRFVFGFNFDANWKNFDFSCLVQGVAKRNFYLNQEAMAPFAATYGNYSYKMHNDYWTPENPNASLPRHYAGSGHNYATSDHWLQNAAYARLKNLQLGYTLSQDLTRKWGIERLRVYFSGENLCEYSKLNKNFDPELQSIGGYAYPIMRSFSFGLNLNF